MLPGLTSLPFLRRGIDLMIASFCCRISAACLSPELALGSMWIPYAAARSSSVTWSLPATLKGAPENREANEVLLSHLL